MTCCVAVVQMLAGTDKKANLAVAEAFVGQAASEGAQFVALPELFFWRGPSTAETGAAETIHGPAITAMADLARGLGIHILAGSILERVEGQERVCNTSVLLGPQGDVLARYRKIHLFDVALKDAKSLTESRFRLPGSEPVVVSTDMGVLGLSVCYDLRFPELFRSLALLGAEIVCLPSAFLRHTGQAHWEVLIRARAIENGIFVIAPNQVGEGPDGMVTYGHSLVVDPWGEVLARGGDEPGIITATIDLERLTEVRSQIPTLSHVRLRSLPDGKVSG